MALPYFVYDHTSPVLIPDERKRLELLSMQRVLPACPEVQRCYFTKAPHNDNHDALMVETLTLMEGSSYIVLIYLVTPPTYPNQPPMAFVAFPDVSEVIAQNIHIHTYRSHASRDKHLDGKGICGEMYGGWKPQSTLGQFYNSVISPWIANFTCFLHYGGKKWPADNWQTTTEKPERKQA